MQAGTEFAMESCSRLGFARGMAGSLRDPVDQGQGLAGRGHAFAGGTLGWRSLRFRGAGPILLWVQKVGKGENGSIILKRLRSKGACVCVFCCLYLWLSASMVFLLGQVLSALGLSTGYVVCNSHWKQWNLLEQLLEATNSVDTDPENNTRQTNKQ